MADTSVSNVHCEEMKLRESSPDLKRLSNKLRRVFNSWEGSQSFTSLGRTLATTRVGHCSPRGQKHMFLSRKPELALCV